MKRGITLIKKWWWVLLLPLLLFIPWEKLKNFFSDRVNLTWAESIAESLHYAMLGRGTDEDVMFKSLEDLNQFELKEVFEAFGNRKYAWWGHSFGGAAIDLFGWFNAELNEKEKTQMRKIWVKSGLTITF